MDIKMLIDQKNILVIGGTGTIGQALTKEILKYNPHVVRVFSRDEYKQFQMQQELSEHENIRFLLGDIRDRQRLLKAMQHIDVVFHLAALKHVPSCEYNPFEAVKTNVMGTQNVIECAIEQGVERVIYTSSDKAISPTNTMGATKLLAERLIASADYSKGGNTPIFCAVRFGNVMGSRGSVIPLFKKQILEKKCITITDAKMSRFMMSISEAVALVIKAGCISKGGEIFVLKMPALFLGDLAQAVIEETCDQYDIPLDEVQMKQIGLRPGEKMYEELMTEDEMNVAKELEQMVKIPNSIVAAPQKETETETETETRTYAHIVDSSKVERYLSIEQIKNIIRIENLL